MDNKSEQIKEMILDSEDVRIIQVSLRQFTLFSKEMMNKYQGVDPGAINMIAQAEYTLDKLKKMTGIDMDKELAPFKEAFREGTMPFPPRKTDA